MKKYSVLLALTMVACGSTKKTLNTDRTETEATITTTRTIDTLITLPADSVVLSRPLAELVETGHIEAQDGNISVKVEYDKATGRVRATATSLERKVPVKATETTAGTFKQKKDTKQLDLDRKTTGGFAGGMIFTFILIFLVVVVAVFLYLYFRGLLPWPRK